ncbi:MULTISPECIES: hypothetical protein [Pseudomonas]|jgi:hypothetical protein|uniref:Heme exporter protein D n=1 Tax=Pseudomonas luteola TaxID=47886 RepID=A0A2X2BX05_PSELU|nr:MULTISPECIES: hypothetical protein [Pseudomonas]SHJ71268.1 hypothetical protein SAMN05216295_12418 [Pseudomonas zeshuii]SPZ00257.1 Uncharacterised protein [Pseudomonas luteola]
MSQTAAGLLIYTFVFITMGGTGLYALWCQKRSESEARKALHERHS